MLPWSSRWIRALPAAMVILILFGGIGLPVVVIQFRLWRNNAIAARLVELLRARFPTVEFRGSASYEREVVYIGVVRGLDPNSYPEVEQWLRRLKREQRIAPAIWLSFPDSTGEEENFVKI